MHQIFDKNIDKDTNMHNKSISNISSYDGSNDSTNFKTAHKHATYKLSTKIFNFIIL